MITSPNDSFLICDVGFTTILSKVHQKVFQVFNFFSVLQMTFVVSRLAHMEAEITFYQTLLHTSFDALELWWLLRRKPMICIEIYTLKTTYTKSSSEPGK